jgi:hypothetical protein
MDIIQKKASRTDEVWKELDLALAHKFLLRAKPETSGREPSLLHDLKPFLKGHGVPKPGKHTKPVQIILLLKNINSLTVRNRRSPSYLQSLNISYQ